MAFESFRPELWSGQLLTNLRNAHVAVGLCNRNYEGEVSEFGQVVKISQIGTINISDYSADVSTVTPQKINGAQTQLHINQSKSFSFEIDDVNKSQMKPKVMSEAMQESAWAVNNTADTFILNKYTEAQIVTSLGTEAAPINLTSVNVTESLGLVNQRMDMANIPLEGRYLIIHPWVKQKIILAKIMLDTNNSTTLTNGFVGSFMGLNIFVSNNVSVNSASLDITRNLAGYSGSMTYADQSISVEAFRPETSFHDAIKGLHIYGAKVFGDRLACLRADYTAEP